MHDFILVNRGTMVSSVIVSVTLALQAIVYTTTTIYAQYDTSQYDSHGSQSGLYFCPWLVVLLW